MMPIEISMAEYRILERLTSGESLYGVQPGLQYEFVSEGGIRSEADSIAIVSLIDRAILKPSVDGPELRFQGNLSDFSLAKFKKTTPRPTGKQNPKRY
jgi:hypothetical protein